MINKIDKEFSKTGKNIYDKNTEFTFNELFSIARTLNVSPS